MAAKNKNVKPSGTAETGIRFNIFFIFLFVILPLVYFQTAQDSTLMPRLLVLALFLAGFTLYLYISDRKTTPDKTFLKDPVLMLGGGYLLWSAISLAFSFNPAEGSFDIVKTGLTLLLVVYAARLFAATPGWYTKLSEIIIVSSFIALIIGFYQYISLVAGNSSGKLPDGREIIYAVKGLMGHKNEFASSLMLMLPFAIYTVFTRKGIWQLLAAISSVFITLLLILLATRAVWVCLFIGGFCIGMIMLFNQKGLELQKHTVKKILLAGSIIIVLLSAGIIEGGRFTHNSLLEKMGSVVRPSQDNNHFRLDIWKITTELAINHPVTGVGPGNWQIAIPAYYDKINLRGKDVNWISPHNDFLWILSEKGIVGLLLYLGMIAMTVLYFFRTLRSKAALNEKRIALALFAGFTSYLVVACFDFPYQRIDHQVMFAILIAGLIGLNHSIPAAKPAMANRHLFFIPVVIFLIFSVVYGNQALNLETRIKKAIALSNAGNQNEALSAIKEAHTPLRSLDAKGTPAAYYAGMIYAAMNNQPEAITSYEAALAEHPNHIAALNNLGKSYYAEKNYALAEQYYLKALKIVPGYKEARVNLSTLYYVKGDYKQSYEMLKGIKGGKRIPEIRRNREALEKLLNIPADSAKIKKHKDKMHKKNKRKNKGV